MHVAASFLLVAVVVVAPLVGDVGSIPVNMALNRPITAQGTCGADAPETFYPHSEIIISSSLRMEDVCDASDSQSSHPPELMVDGSGDTWWQSASRERLRERGFRPPEADTVIIIDLHQEFRVEEIILLMGDARRPGRVAIDKSLDGAIFQPWAYKVSAEDDCRNAFGVGALSRPRNPTSVICTEFARVTPASKNEQVLFDFKTAADVPGWSATRFVRARFYDIDATLGGAGDAFQHYAVRELQVWAECVCSGVALGCERDAGTGVFRCVCGGNTSGELCDACLPLYNQQLFLEGRPCERCQCHDHADACDYDAAVASRRGSISVGGERVGGGLCRDCAHNTTGVNCERCATFFYRPVGRSAFDADACVPCDCDTAGAAAGNAALGVAHGACVADQDEAAQRNMRPGDCYCKTNVGGVKCDVCRPGFYELDAANAAGCSPCRCDVTGTLDARDECDPVTGQCPCRPAVTGRRCDVCSDGYYDLVASHADGCLECACDVGGATSKGCDKRTGACECRANVDGGRCDRPRRGFFVPDLHFMRAEAEDINALSFARDVAEHAGFRGFGYATLTGNVSLRTSLSVADGFSGDFYVVLRYIIDTSAIATVELSSREEELIHADVVLPACATAWCSKAVGDFGRPAMFVLAAGRRYRVRIQTQTDGGTLLLDRLSALPAEFYSPTELLGPADAEQFTFRCDVVADDFADDVDGYCRARAFSLVAHYLDGATPCECHGLGSSNSTCEPYGGQCACKQGVAGRKCDQCDVDHYGLSARGCRACDCTGAGIVCDPVSGQCKCPANTQGQRCDECVADHWGFDPGSGCRACACNITGAVATQCDPLTGECRCRPGVTADDCSRCSDGFKHFSGGGCAPCGCDVAGSATPACDPLTGQCECKPLTSGAICDECVEHTFSNAESHVSGCLECVCMGVTSRCAAAFGLYLRTDHLRDYDTWSIVDEQGFEFGIDFNATTVGDDDDDSVAVVLPGGDGMYWDVPALRGNLLLYVGGRLEFTINYTELDSNFLGIPLQQPTVVIRGNLGIDLVGDLPEVSPGNATRVGIVMEHTSWRVASSVNASRAEFLLALSDVRSFLLPASFFLQPHALRMRDFTVDRATSLRTSRRAISVEQCACGFAYEGTSCEACAAGNRRVDADVHKFLGECVPCDCHGHAAVCDEATGRCVDCRHDTDGENCERCADGYYGDATRGTPGDCRQCPCFEPRVNSSVCVATGNSVRCLDCNPGYVTELCNRCDDFYYGNPATPGGTCRPCDCSGNSDVCDGVSGRCRDCRFETMGNNCDQCSFGFYGNATLQNCQLCDCDNQGSTSQLCDQVTGQCECHPGVGTRICSHCEEGYWGYFDSRFIGCRECECNEHGSLEGIHCLGQDGSCRCRLHVLDELCDQCEINYWGLPTQPCQTCSCDPIGTVDIAEPCDRTDGQCRCKPGIGGRRCDQCQPLYFEFGTEGCRVCGECHTSVGEAISKLTSRALRCWNESQELSRYLDNDFYLLLIESQLEEPVAFLGTTTGQLNRMQREVRALTAQAPLSRRQLDRLVTRIERTRDASVAQSLQTTGIVDRSELFWEQADELLVIQLEANATYHDKVADVQRYANASDRQLQLLHISDHEITLNFTLERQQVSAEVDNVRGVLEDISALRKLATGLESKVNETRTLGEALRTLLEEMVANVTERHRGVLQTQLETVQIEQLLAVIHAKMEQVDGILAEALDLLNVTSMISSTSQTIYRNATYMLIDADDILEEWKRTTGRLKARTESLGKMIGEVNDQVSAAGNFIAQLEADSRDIAGEFDSVAHIGSEAVDAMTSYTAALLSVQTTETLAEQADAAITAALSAAADVPALTADAADALARARTIADNSTATHINVPRLRDDIAAANASAHAQLATWRRDVVAGVSALRQRAGGVEHEATERATLARAHVTARIVDAAQATAVRIAREQDDGGALTRMERIVDSAGEASADVVQRIMSLDEAATSLGARATRVVATVARASETLQHDDDAATTIIEKMRSIERKLSRVVSTAAALKRPTLLDSGATALQFNIVHRSPVHNQVALEFRAENISFDALLYFAEERQGGGAIYLQLISGRLHLGFHAREGATVNVTSEAQLCSRCWLHVHATRFADKAFLTVVDLQTGRQTTGYAQTDDASVRNVTITSPAYVGGLPANYVTNKPVTAERFVGCLFHLEVDDQPVSLHRSVTPPPTDPTRCCVAPPMRQRDDAWNVRCDDQDCSQAVRFTGIHSYLQMEPQDIEVGNRSEFLFDFTTHSSNAPLVIVRSDNGAEYLLSLTAGRVSLSISKPNATTLRMRTRGASYGDGSFYQLHARHNTSVASLRLSYLNATSSAVVEDLHAAVRGRLARFPALPRFFLGGDGSSGGASFAGCMRHFYHGTAFRGVTPRDLDALVVASAGVSRHCAHPTVVGISFRGDGSYAQMNVSSGVTLADLYSSRVTFKTRAPSGVALFATDADGNALYVALYNGDIFIQIVVAWTQLLLPIRTAGLGLDDGRWHTVQFDAGDAIPALMVDGVRYIHTRPVQLPRGPAVEVYLGGTPVRVIKQRELPVTRSYRGDVTSMSVNGNRIDLADLETVLESEGVAIDAVLPAADSAPPADKFVAIVSSECEPVELSNITVPGLRFGRERGSHAVFSMRGFGSDPLRSMLVLTMRFRSLAPSGMLMYAASSLRLPRDYMCLYLQEGRLVFSMQTSPRDRRTERLASNKKYADGNQWEVNVVRMNNFVAMVITEAHDYVNNGLDSERDASSLVQPDLYIGGVPTSARTPSLLADVPALQGCVMHVTVGTTERTRALQLQDPVTSSGTAACAASERAGLSFSGAGYAVVSSRFTLGASLSFTLVLHAHNASALLLYAATSPTDFLVVDINATTARLFLSNGVRDAYETTVGLRGGPLCDAREHTVTADMNTRSVTLSVDGLAEETTFNNGFSLVTLASRLYLGGAPPGGGGVTGDRLPNAEAPDFSGCVKRMVLNGNDVALHELRRENVDYGCIDPATDTH